MISLKFGKYKSVIGKWLLSAGILAVISFPIIITPMLDPEPYKEIQKIGRKDIVQQDVQPGNMRIWRDPFDRRKDRVAEEKK